MRNDLLERLMRIAAATGERHVLVDARLPEPVVVLPLSAYEGLVAQRSASSAAPVLPDMRGEPQETWEPEPASPAVPDPVTESKESLNEEEKFYLEPID